MRRFSLLSLLTAIMLVALVFSHIVTSLELQNLKNTSKVKIFEVVESGPNNGGGGSDIAILIAATLPEEAFELARQNDFSDPWTIYEVGTCKGQMKYDGAVYFEAHILWVPPSIPEPGSNFISSSVIQRFPKYLMTRTTDGWEIAP